MIKVPTVKFKMDCNIGTIQIISKATK